MRSSCVSPEHKALEPEREKLRTALKEGKLSMREYDIAMGRLHKIPECCISYYIDEYEPGKGDGMRRECPEDYVHCPKCRGEKNED